MNALRSFHLPRGGRPAFAEGALSITGLGAWLFPASPCRTVVRVEGAPRGGGAGAPTKGDADDTTMWMRSFGGRAFVGTQHAFLDDQPRDGTFHQVETAFPVSLTFDWRASESRDPETKRCAVEPEHVQTLLAGFLPVPLFLVGARQRMLVHSDQHGWDLHVSVRAFGGRINLITYEGAMRKRDPAVGNFVDGFHDVVLFDGVCNLCNASVDFLIQRDVDRRLMFCAQQSPEAQAVLQSYADRNPNDSTVKDLGLVPSQEGNEGADDSVLVLGSDGKLRDQSDAALRAGEALGGGWRALALAARMVPSGLRDYVYGAVGRHRYQWFGKTEACRLPTAEERQRFL